MGSMIHLALGRLELDWGKNNFFTSHSALFQESDVAKIPYYYAGDELAEIAGDGSRYEVITEYKEGLSKPLHHVMDRLRLLGYSRKQAKAQFDYFLKAHDCGEMALSFESFEAVLKSLDLDGLSADYGEGGEDFGKFFRRHILPRLKMPDNDDNCSEISFAEAMENVSAYAVLNMVAENPTARGLNVNWAFNDLEENGWATRSEFVRPLAARERFLIVTEGSSDANIIRRAFELLRPHIADFFQYIDMQEGYPFTGTGNVFRFVQGLTSISIQNNVVVLYDNDTEGENGYERTKALNLPQNMQVLKLPDRQEFEAFNSQGPSGSARANINGRAAAIECYLDLGKSPAVRWTGYNAKAEAYQGELIDKERYAKAFLKQRARQSDYDYGKLESVLTLIVDTCSTMSEGQHISAFNEDCARPQE